MARCNAHDLIAISGLPTDICVQFTPETDYFSNIYIKNNKQTNKQIHCDQQLNTFIWPYMWQDRRKSPTRNYIGIFIVIYRFNEQVFHFVHAVPVQAQSVRSVQVCRSARIEVRLQHLEWYHY